MAVRLRSLLPRPAILPQEPITIKQEPTDFATNDEPLVVVIHHEDPKTNEQEVSSEAIGAAATTTYVIVKQVVDETTQNVTNVEQQVVIPTTQTLLAIPSTIAKQIVKQSSQSETKVYTCPTCSKQFSHPFSLKRHIKTHSTESKCRFVCGLCPFASQTIGEFERHIRDAHGVFVVNEFLKFSSRNDFETWKASEEKRTMSSFVLHRGIRKMGSNSTVRYYCNRSGNFVSHGKGKRRIRSQGTCKIGSYCPAKMTVNEYGSEVTVTYCKTHFGHSCSRGYIRVPRTDNETISGMLTAGMSFDKTLDKIRSSVNSGFERLHLLTKLDKNNIIKAYGTEEDGQKVTNDADQLDHLIGKMSTMGENNPVLFYKPRGVVISEVEHLYRKDDFALMLMNNFQKDIASVVPKHDVICIDSPHGPTSHDVELLSVLTIDDHGESFPIAFLISNRHDFSVMNHFFLCVKQQTGQLQVHTFMSDDIPDFYAAWAIVMGNSDMQLLCTWLVDRAWRDNLNLISDRVDQIRVYHSLRLLMEMLNEADFEVALPRVIEDLLENPKTAKFGAYFQREFLPNSKVWAYCYRKGSKGSCVHLEYMHDLLKYVYMWGRNMKRLDKCVDILLKMVKDKEFCKLNKMHKGRAAHKLKIIQEGHSAAEKLTMSYLVYNVSNGEKFKWKLKALRSGEVYTVERMAANSCCSQVCDKCGICIHQFVCSCFDAVKGVICKHVHLVVYFTNHENLEIMTESQVKEEIEATNRNDKKAKLMEMLHELTDSLAQVDNDVVLDKIASHLDEVSDLVNTSDKCEVLSEPVIVIRTENK